jgi:lycopene beta-cyclase
MSTMFEKCDVLIIGAGPAGRALAFEFATLKHSVIVVDSNPFEQWKSTYGTWVDDLDNRDDAAELGSCFQRIWPQVRVVGKAEHQLSRPYGIFDNSLLQRYLTHDAVRFHKGDVVRIQHNNSDVLHVQLSTSEQFEARIVFDCGGTQSSLLLRDNQYTGGFQSAYGVHTEAVGTVQAGSFTLMDWSTPAGASANPATFLYAFDLGNGTAMVEETSLVERDAVSDAVLRQRLEQRLGRDFSQATQQVEHVRIAMGGSLPSRIGPVVGFGAAAGFIHPVTGYSVAASLRAAPRVARAVSEALARADSADDIARIGWNAVWPTSFLRTRVLHDFGLAALSRLTTTDIQVFFDHFFSLPQSHWTGYLRIDTKARVIAQNMTRLFFNVPMRIKIKLVRKSPLGLIRCLLPGRFL